MGSGSSISAPPSSSVTREEARKIAGPGRWNDFFWLTYADLDAADSDAACCSAEAWAALVAAEEAQRGINFEAIADLQADDDCSRGRLMVNVKDRIGRLAPVLKLLQAAAGPEAATGKGMTRDEFRSLCLAQELLAVPDYEPEQCDNHFFEVAGWPDDEDDAAQVSAIRLDLGKLATALVRVANDMVVSLGDTSLGLDEQLCRLLRDHAAKMPGVGAGEKVNLDELCEAPLRDSSFFAPSADALAALGGKKERRVFIDFAIGDDRQGQRRVEFELAFDVAPVTAYNFYCLCTGERGRGEISGEVLRYRAADHPTTPGGCGIHRIVPGMAIQGGDFTLNDGNGGESIYGGHYQDETFEMKHDAPYILSSANAGPHTNSSQFFVTLAAAPSLDGENVAFGKVVSGTDVIDEIGALPVDEETEAPTTKVTIVDCGAVVGDGGGGQKGEEEEKQPAGAAGAAGAGGGIVLDPKLLSMLFLDAELAEDGGPAQLALIAATQMEVDDTALAAVVTKLFADTATGADANASISRDSFVRLVSSEAWGCDVDADAAGSKFDDVCGYPPEEADDPPVKPMTLSLFVHALIFVANLYVLQVEGMTHASLEADQLRKLLRKVGLMPA
eukprot:g2791.t1